ncbi:transposase [Streptomyces mirabilis]
MVRPLLPVPGWLHGRGGQPEAYCDRAMLDAVRYLVDNGTKWRAMPSDFPPWDRVYAFFRRWARPGPGHRVPRPAAGQGPRKGGPGSGAERGRDRLPVGQGGRRRRRRQPRFRRRKADQRPQAPRRR